jgi:hypothetical protein
MRHWDRRQISVVQRKPMPMKKSPSKPVTFCLPFVFLNRLSQIYPAAAGWRSCQREFATLAQSWGGKFESQLGRCHLKIVRQGVWLRLRLVLNDDTLVGRAAYVWNPGGNYDAMCYAARLAGLRGLLPSAMHLSVTRPAILVHLEEAFLRTASRKAQILALNTWAGIGFGFAQNLSIRGELTPLPANQIANPQKLILRLPENNFARLPS